MCINIKELQNSYLGRIMKLRISNTALGTENLNNNVFHKVIEVSYLKTIISGQCKYQVEYLFAMKYIFIFVQKKNAFRLRYEKVYYRNQMARGSKKNDDTLFLVFVLNYICYYKVLNISRKDF